MRGFLAACCVLLAACTADPTTNANLAAAPGGHILTDTVLPPPLPPEQTLLVDLGYYPVRPVDLAENTALTGTRSFAAPDPAPRLHVDTARHADIPDPPNDIAGVQSLLDQMGYAPGPIDGIMGPLTRTAIVAFRTRLGLEPAGGDLSIITAQLESARLVPEAQQLLTELGYVPGAIDGVPGPLTRAALAAFQIRYGLEEDSIVSIESLERLRAVVVMREIQIRLAGLGYDPGPADGILGPRTKKAIQFFERDRDLPPVGWATAVVRERLREAPYIEETQRLLAMLGYDAGPVTRRDNAQTRAAIRAFQSASNLSPTGRATADLLLMIQDQARAILTPAAGSDADPHQPILVRAGSTTPATASPLLTRLMPLAEEGAPSAQHIIAGLYMRGQGIPADLPVAFDWYEQAANQGFAPAQFRLGLMYAFGIGTEVDEPTATAWFKQAALHGHPGAAKALAALGEFGGEEYPIVR